MTGRPGHRTMEMIGGSSTPYLACTPCVPLIKFILCLIGVETEGFLDYQGRAGITSIVQWSLRPVIFGVELLFRSPIGFSDNPPSSHSPGVPRQPRNSRAGLKFKGGGGIRIGVPVHCLNKLKTTPPPPP